VRHRDTATQIVFSVNPPGCVALGNLLDTPKPNVVPRIRILGPRISEPHNEPDPKRLEPNQRILRGSPKQAPQELEHPAAA
jgi:hypothetical protein